MIQFLINNHYKYLSVKLPFKIHKDNYEVNYNSKIHNYNPRSREGSDRLPVAISNTPFNFNPRSREGSDVERDDRRTLFIISIHAPARGATVISSAIFSTPSLISIHAPARGATLYHCHNTLLYDVFQSTLPRGERLSDGMIHIPARKFQSTLPRGERPNFTPTSI